MRITPLLLGALLSTAAVAAPIPPQPVAQRGTTVDTIQGVQVADPYRWLETAGDPQVKAWVAGQNASSRAYLDGLPMRAALFDYLMGIEKATATFDTAARQAGGRLFVMTISPDKQQPTLSSLALSGDAATRRTILDPNLLSAKGGTAIDWFEPSPDGKLIAVSLSEGGSEDGTLHIYDVDAGKQIEAPIAHVQFPTAGGSLAWTADAKGYWYTRFPGAGTPAADLHFNQQVYFHRIGADAAADKLVLATKDGLPRTAEIFLDNRYAGANALAAVQLGDGGEWQHFLLPGDGAAPHLIAAYDDKIVAGTIGPDGAFYGISRKGAPNGKIVRLADPLRATAATAKVIVPEAKTALVSDGPTNSLTIAGDHIFATAIDGGPTVIRMFTLDGRSLPMTSPPVATIALIEPAGDGGIFFRQRTYVAPPVTMRWTPGAGAPVATPLTVPSPLSFADVAVTRVFATSKDGTKVPLTIVARKGTKLDGTNPAWLTGYGGYGVNITPHFLGAGDRAWLDAGGVWAVANIRGGGEYGERWHQQGSLTHKQNVFDDFTASAQYLIDQKWTSSAKLGIEGGSNGGLLMGAVVTQHPALARAVVSSVGIYDMMRVELDPNGSFNVTEFGTVKDPAQFKALYAYSPLHHVTKGAPYPAMLLTTGDNDGRVNPLHSRKFAAAMQAATGSGRPIYLRTSANAGHGQGSSLDEAIGLEADVDAFMMDQLGMKWTPPAK